MSKIKYEDVKDAASFHGWELISKEYVNLKTEMEFKCPQGHIVNSTWKKVRENFNCPICIQAQENYGAVEIKPKSKGVTRIIALDQATNISGWSVYDNKELIAFGKIEFTQSDTFERMTRLRQWLINMIENWKPDKIGLEDIQLQSFTGKNGRENTAVTTYKVLAQLQGVLGVTANEKGINPIIVHTATWRSYCGIHAKSRNDQKRAAQILVKKKFDKDATQDEADAICIGMYIAEKYLRNNEMIDFDNL